MLVLALLVTLEWHTSSSAAENDALAEEIAKIVSEPRCAKMRLGLRVETLSSQPTVIYERNSHDLFKPASNQKLVTTAAALRLLPPDFGYRTILAIRGQDLVVIGDGDPSLGDPRVAKLTDDPIDAVFLDWAEKLKRSGITRISGDLIFDDFIFDQVFVHPSWRGKFNLQAGYTAPVGGLNFNNNCIGVVVKPASTLNQLAQVSLVPPCLGVKLDNKTVTARKGEPAVKRTDNGGMSITVSGSVSRANNAANPLNVAVSDPGAFFAGALRAALADEGIQIAGQTRRQRITAPGFKLPPDVKIVAAHESKLADILWRINKSSVNMSAEALLKTLGARPGPGLPIQQGSLKTAREAVVGFLHTLSLPSDLYFIDDGSGLSHENRLSPVVLTTILQYMDRHPQREVWWANLATPGEKDSTLIHRMKDLNDSVRAKTGHIAGVSALSGYVLGPGNRRYAFSILCNDTYKAKGGPSSADRLEESICRLLANWEPTTSTKAK